MKDKIIKWIEDEKFSCTTETLQKGKKKECTPRVRYERVKLTHSFKADGVSKCYIQKCDLFNADVKVNFRRLNWERKGITIDKHRWEVP